MKGALFALASLAAAVSVAGCGGGSDDDTTARQSSTSKATPLIPRALVGRYTTKEDRAYTLRIATTGGPGGSPSLTLDAGSKCCGVDPTVITVEGNTLVLHNVLCGSRAEEPIYGTQIFRWELDGSTLTLKEAWNDCGYDDESLETEVLEAYRWTKKSATD